MLWQKLLGAKTAGGASPTASLVGITKTAAAGSTLTIAKPSGVIDGDLLVAFMSTGTTNGTWTPPSGWTEILDQSSGGSARPSVAVMYKVAASEGTSYSFVTTGSPVAGLIIAVRSASYGSIGSLALTTASTSITVHGLATSNGVIAFVVSDSGSGSTFTTTSGMTLGDVVDGTSVDQGLFYDLSATGTVADASFSYNGGAAVMAGVMVALGF